MLKMKEMSSPFQYKVIHMSPTAAVKTPAEAIRLYNNTVIIIKTLNVIP